MCLCVTITAMSILLPCPLYKTNDHADPIPFSCASDHAKWGTTGQFQTILQQFIDHISGILALVRQISNDGIAWG